MSEVEPLGCATSQSFASEFRMPERRPWPLYANELSSSPGPSTAANCPFELYSNWVVSAEPSTWPGYTMRHNIPAGGAAYPARTGHASPDMFESPVLRPTLEAVSPAYAKTTSREYVTGVPDFESGSEIRSSWPVPGR